MKTGIVFLALTLWGALAAPSNEVPVDASAELAEFTKGNRLFSANLYKQIIKNQPGNFISSPLSAEIVLALTNEGAVGKTSEELQAGISLPSNKETIQKALKFFLPKLQTSEKDLKLLTANKIYTGKDVKINEKFHEIADNVYKAGVENVDFGASEQAANTINHWVEERTNNKIKNLVKKDSLSSDTKLVLVNALYFSGKWVNHFEEFATRKDKFYRTKDDVSEVDMMHQTDYFNYYENKKLNTKFIELQYEGGNISLVIALPNEIDGLSKLENNIEELLEPQPFTSERVDLRMPKFRIETEIQMKPILEELGIKKIFSPEAELTGLSSTHNRLAVDEVVQKAFIDVNEDGTEAAAATAVIVVDRISIGQSFEKPLIFYAERPFLYYLKTDNVIAFTGRFDGIFHCEGEVEVPQEVIKPVEVEEATKPKDEVVNTTTMETVSKPESKPESTHEVVTPLYVEKSTSKVETSSQKTDTTSDVQTIAKVETTPKLETTLKVESTPKVETTTKIEPPQKKETISPKAATTTKTETIPEEQTFPKSRD